MTTEAVRAFVLNNAVLAHKLAELNGERVTQVREELLQDPLIRPYVPQIKHSIREAAEIMSLYYSLFFMLENHIRSLIDSFLAEEFGPGWWASEAVPKAVRDSADANKKRELEAGFSLRSQEMLPYTNFGELGDIVRENWPIFGQVFRDKGHFNRVMFNLNLLRATIAHCGVLSEDEVLRLKLTFRDWFRLME